MPAQRRDQSRSRRGPAAARIDSGNRPGNRKGRRQPCTVGSSIIQSLTTTTLAQTGSGTDLTLPSRAKRVLRSVLALSSAEFGRAASRGRRQARKGGHRARLRRCGVRIANSMTRACVRASEPVSHSRTTRICHPQ